MHSVVARLSVCSSRWSTFEPPRLDCAAVAYKFTAYSNLPAEPDPFYGCCFGAGMVDPATSQGEAQTLPLSVTSGNAGSGQVAARVADAN